MMEQLQLAIALGDGQTLQAQPRPEDERRLAEVLGDRSAIEFASNDADDIEGHAISGDVTVDVEGHAITIRLPNGGDAAALRRALAVGAVTATIVGAGAIAAWQPPVAAPTTTVQAPAAGHVRQVPALAVGGQDAELQGQQNIVVAPITTHANSPAVPAPALRAQDAEQAGQQNIVVAPITTDANNPAVPAPALRA